ncbi:MAG: trigger factor [bacterium]
MNTIQYEKDIKIDPKKAQIDIDVRVSPEEYMKIWENSAKKYAGKVTMPGFRKGKVPMNVVKTKYYEEISQASFDDMVNTIAKDCLQSIEQKPISALKIDIVSDNTEKDKNIAFTLSFAYRVDPKLADLSTIKVVKPEIVISDEEMQQSLALLLNSINSRRIEEEKDELTEWTDEIIKELNIKDVNNLDELKILVKSEIEKQKVYENEMQFRSSILDEIIKKSEMNLPVIILEEMLAQQEFDYKTRIEKLGFEYDKYIEEKNINLEELRKEWENMIKIDLAREFVLSQYAIDNKIEPSEEELDQAIINASPEMKEKYSPETMREYMKYVLSNNIAFAKIYSEVVGE